VYQPFDNDWSRVTLNWCLFVVIGWSLIFFTGFSLLSILMRAVLLAIVFFNSLIWGKQAEQSANNHYKNQRIFILVYFFSSLLFGYYFFTYLLFNLIILGIAIFGVLQAKKKKPFLA
jgi:hypothetical protein